MKLYQVKYGVWNHSFSKLSPGEQLSVGNDETEAIARIKEVVDKDARDFSAQEISSVFGFELMFKIRLLHRAWRMNQQMKWIERKE